VQDELREQATHAAGAIPDVEHRLKAEGTAAAEAFEVVEEEETRCGDARSGQ